MKPTRSISRRSFLKRVGGGAALAGGALSLTGCFGMTDSDPYDPIGGGRGGRRGRRGRRDDDDRGCTDRDRGQRADPPGRGRCGGRR